MKTEKREVDSEEKREHQIPDSREGYHIEIGVIEQRESGSLVSDREREKERQAQGVVLGTSYSRMNDSSGGGAILQARDLHNKSKNVGLISVDRKTSLLSHVQYPVPAKSSTEDLTLIVPERRVNEVFGRSLSLRVNTKSGISSLSSMDSDLEAFSHYPADGSFGALAVQPTP